MTHSSIEFIELPTQSTKTLGVLVSAELMISCRAGCGACCIAPSISSRIPDMPNGKPAGVRCIQLADDFSCLIFHSPDRPKVCASLKASVEMCGQNRTEAMSFIDALERATQ